MDTSLRVSLSLFYCEKCRNKFEGTPIKREYMHPVYGACTTYYSNCPECGSEAAEYHQPNLKKSKNNSAPACGSGGCSCCG